MIFAAAPAGYSSTTPLHYRGQCRAMFVMYPSTLKFFEDETLYKVRRSLKITRNEGLAI